MDMTSTEVELARAARESERASRSNVDRQILKHARLSIEEISQKVGIEPFEVAERLDNLLRSRDFLSERQQERLLIIEMGELISEMRDRASGAGDDNYADIANAALRGYDMIGKRLDARRKLTELEISDITRAQGEMFLSVLLEALDLVSTRMEELHPDSDYDIRLELEEAFAIALPEAREAVNKRVRE